MGLCISFIVRGALFGVVPVKLFVVSATHNFTPNILEYFRVGLSSNGKSVSGTIDCWNCHQMFLHWRLNGIFKWVHQDFYMIGKMFLILSEKYMLTYCIKEVIKGRIFWRLNEKVPAYEAATAWNRGIRCNFFQNTDPIVFVLFVYLFLTYCIKESIEGNIFGHYI